jgi:hypothetical protein
MVLAALLDLFSNSVWIELGVRSKDDDLLFQQGPNK